MENQDSIRTHFPDFVRKTGKAANNRITDQIFLDGEETTG